MNRKPLPSTNPSNRLLPGLQLLRTYQSKWLAKDVAAGLVLTAMLVPVGIAYAQASGLPGIHGLYATIVPLLVYALVGPSRILVLGPDSALAAIILSVAVTGSPWAAIWPLTWARVVGRAPGQYVRFVGLWIVSVVLGLVVLWSTLRGLTGTMPGDVAAAFVWNLFWFFQASLVGEYVRRNAPAFGLD